MIVILAADIFGIKDYLYQFAEELSQAGFKPLIVSPYSINTPPFYHETEAYQHFCSVTSVEKYTAKLADIVASQTDNVIIVGFSVGAAASYVLATSTPVNKVIAFYGSQIRHYSHLAPLCELLAILPESEQHFCISSLHSSLTRHHNVTCMPTPYQHGFMNPHSSAYQVTAAHNWQSKVITLLHTPTP